MIDNSGSMQTTDPNNVRLIAAQQFIDLLEEGDQAALVDFSSGSKVPVALRTLRSDADRDAFVGPLRAMKADGFTDIRAALRDAFGQLTSANVASEERFVVFLTDGAPFLQGWSEPPTPGQLNPYRADLERLAAEFGQAGIPIFPISLEQATDVALMQALAGRTGGEYFAAPRASDLGEVFQRIFARLKKANQVDVPRLCAPPEQRLQFPIDRFVKTAILSLARDQDAQVTVLDPQGRERPPDHARGVVFTYDSPSPGQWTLRVTGSGCLQGTIITPTFGPIRALIREPRGGTVRPPSQQMEVVVDVMQLAQGNTEAAVPGAQVRVVARPENGPLETLDLRATTDGYRGSLTSTGRVGVLTIEAEASKPNESTTAPPVTIELRETPTPLPEEPGAQVSLAVGERFTVRARPSVSGIRDPVIVVEVVTPDQAHEEVRLTRDGDRFVGSYQPKKSGDYQLTYRLSGKFGQIGDTVFEAPRQERIAVTLRTPDLALTAPEANPDGAAFKLGRDGKITLVADVTLDSKALPSDSVKLDATLHTPEKTDQPVELHWDGSHWVGEIKPASQGRYALTLSAAGAVDGVSYATPAKEQEMTVSFTWQRVLLALWWLGAVLLAATLVLFLITRPRIPRGLEVIVDGQVLGTGADLKPRGFMNGAVFGGRPNDAIDLNLSEPKFEMRPSWMQFGLLKGGSRSRLRVRPMEGVTLKMGGTQLDPGTWHSYYPSETLEVHSPPNSRKMVKLEAPETPPEDSF